MTFAPKRSHQNKPCVCNAANFLDR